MAFLLNDCLTIWACNTIPVVLVVRSTECTSSRIQTPFDELMDVNMLEKGKKRSSVS